MSIPPIALRRLEALPAVSLAELQTGAAFLTRQDRKYLVPGEALPELIAGLEAGTRVLEIDGRRSFTYITPYFDDPARSAYLLAARKRPNRFKVRTRYYVESGLRLLEVKVRDSFGRTVKHRMEHAAGELEELSDDERAWIAGFPQVGARSDRLEHCMTTEYERITLALPENIGRVTIDRNLRFTDPSGACCEVSRLITIETKGAGKPTSVDRLLWRRGFRPVAVSKFASGLSLLNPELPANRWNRVLNRIASDAVFAPAGRMPPGAHATVALPPAPGSSVQA